MLQLLHLVHTNSHLICPYLAESCGAVYVARWTSLHIRRATKSIAEALVKPGFSFIEVISPCPTLYARRNRLGSGLGLNEILS